MKKFLYLGLIFLLFATNLSYGDTTNNDPSGTVSGWLLDKTAILTRNNNLGLQRNEAYIDYQKNSVVNFDLGIRFRYQSYLTPSDQKQIDIRALTLGKQYENWSWRFGRQIMTWGKADGFRVLDIVNPYDYTEFVLDDMMESKKALTMLRTDYFFNNNNDSFQLLIIPEYRKDTIPSPSSEFYPLPSVFSSFQPNIINTPNQLAPNNWQYGFKWEHLGEKASLTLNYLNKWSTQSPLYLTTPSNLIISQTKREQFWGGSIDFPWKSFVFRSEIVYSPSLYSPNYNPLLMPNYGNYSNVSLVLGSDYTLNDWLLSAQIFSTKWMGNSFKPVGGFTQNMFTILILKKFMQDKLKFKVFSAYDQTNKGGWIEPNLTWDVGNGLETGIGMDLFNGSQQSVFGRFYQDNRVYLSIKWSFLRGV